MSEEETARILVEGGPVHRRVNHTLAGLIGFVLGVAAGFGYLLIVIHSNSITNCRQIELVKTAERGTFQEAGRLTASSKGLTAAQRAQSVTFYRDALERLKPRSC